jgi:hypothetical protein
MVIMKGVLIITKAHVTTHPTRIYLQKNMINSILLKQFNEDCYNVIQTF